ncbi:phosphodiester glycosidase family protein [Nonomuraea sp. KM88]|uniref:phosphodiester glycosidase family protein n=1 Tax=Nonomuraea sp. KM88 TaxID=3457427 RepID=UPI003FCD540B
MNELVRMIVDLGAHSALNLDGGGSTTLIARPRSGGRRTRQPAVRRRGHSSGAHRAGDVPSRGQRQGHGLLGGHGDRTRPVPGARIRPRHGVLSESSPGRGGRIR